MLGAIALTESIILLMHYLALNVPLFCDQPMLTHDLFVKDGGFLLQAGLKEPLSHHLNNFVDFVGLQAREFNPFTGEAGPHLHAMLQVQTVVLGAAVHGEQELTHAHLIAASIFEHSDHDEEYEQVCNYDQHWAPIAATHRHSNRDS